MKTVVLTGATGDLGSVVVPRLMRDYRCAVLYRSKSSWQKIKTEGLIGLGDASEIGSVAPVYALVLLAGGYAEGASAEDYSRLLETNLLSNVRAIDAALPHLDDEGRIVAISSAASLTRPPGLAAYSAAKAGLNATVETLAKDLKSRRIAVNALLPRTIDTDAKRQVVADAIALLLEPQASAITGQLIALTV